MQILEDPDPINISDWINFNNEVDMTEGLKICALMSDNLPLSEVTEMQGYILCILIISPPPFFWD